jgi:hypothetical protein
MPTEPALERALAAVADALAQLPPMAWDELCTEERILTLASVQFWESFGMPEVMLPERVLGARILALFAQRYPHLTGDVGMA